MRRVAFTLLALAASVVPLLQPAGAQAATARRPVIFVHGWSGDSWNWAAYESGFAAAGYTDAELYAWDYDHRLSNRTIAGQLASYVDRVRAATGHGKVDIVTHSMGGLSSRWYLKFLGGTAEVDDWVSIGGPNHGTAWAWGCWHTSCAEMRPGSSFLSTLNGGDETPGGVNYHTFWSPCDEVINPDTSTVLSGAANNRTGCVGHLSLLGDPLTFAGTYAEVR